MSIQKQESPDVQEKKKALSEEEMKRVSDFFGLLFKVAIRTNNREVMDARNSKEVPAKK